MSKNPKISICVVTQDNANYIEKLLNSIKKLKYLEILDIVIVDNHSNDSTREIINQFKGKMNINYTYAEERRPLPANRNLCVQKSIGDIIVMVDSDVEFIQPEFIDNIISIFVKYKEIAILSPIIIDSKTGLAQSLGLKKLLHIPYIFTFNFPGSNPDELHKLINLKLFKIDMIHGACFIFRKSIFTDINGFDEYMVPYNFDEMDFAIRAQLHGYQLFASSTVEIFHYGGGTTRGFKSESRAELFISHGMRSIIRNYSKKLVYGTLIFFLFMTSATFKLVVDLKERFSPLIIFRSVLWALNHKNLPIRNVEEFKIIESSNK